MFAAGNIAGSTVKAYVHINFESNIATYLPIPLYFGQKKKQQFKGIND
jgi:hypothetical protein